LKHHGHHGRSGCDIHKPIALKIIATIIAIPLIILAVAEFQGTTIRKAFHNSLDSLFSFPESLFVLMLFVVVTLVIGAYMKPMLCVWKDQSAGRDSTPQCRNLAMHRLNNLDKILTVTIVTGFIIGRLFELHMTKDILDADRRGTYFLGLMQSLANGLFASVLMTMSLSDILFPVKRAILQQGTTVHMKQNSFIRKTFRALFSMLFFLLMQMSLITFDFVMIGHALTKGGPQNLLIEELPDAPASPIGDSTLSMRLRQFLEFRQSLFFEGKRDRIFNPGRYLQNDRIKESMKVLTIRFFLFILLAMRVLALLKIELRNPLLTVASKLNILTRGGTENVENKICGSIKAAENEQIDIVANDEFSDIFNSINILLTKRREEIQLSQDRLRKIIDNAADPILSFDKNGKIFIFNPAAEAYFGRKRDEVSNFVLRNLFTQDEIDKCGCGEDDHAFIDFLIAQENRRRRFTGFGNDRVLNFEANISTTVTPDGPIYTAILRDIDAQIQFEENLKRSKIEAEKANRLKSEFLANMSHELRTPLNAVLGFTQLMVNDKNLTDGQRDKIRIISRSGEHLLGLINDILDISKIEAGKAELHYTVFNLPRFISDIHEMFSLRCEKKGLSFDMELLDDLPEYIEGDLGKLRQILINLVGNAVKFTEEGGITLVAGSEEGKIKLAVTDTGKGIDENEIDLILEPFVQSSTTTNEGGTGLGLAISSRYIRMMGGELKISSTPGSGSTFSFTLDLKLADAPDKTEEETRIITGIAGSRTYKVLIVDDKYNNRLILKQMLERAGFVVQEAEDGRQAISAALEFRPELIFMDIRMPVMDGYEAVAAIRADKRISNSKIFALTASAFKHDEKRITEAGFDGFLAKPFKMSSLFSLISEKAGVIFQYDDSVPNEQITRVEPDFKAAADDIPKDVTDRILSYLEINDFSSVKKLMESTPCTGDAAVFTAEIIKAASDFKEEKIRKMIEAITIARS